MRHTPKRLPDQEAYASDPFEMRFVFHDLASPNHVIGACEGCRDVSAGLFTATLEGSTDLWAVDMAEAAAGRVWLRLDPVVTAMLPNRLNRADLHEANIWGRTIFEWRIVRTADA